MEKPSFYRTKNKSIKKRNKVTETNKDPNQEDMLKYKEVASQEKENEEVSRGILVLIKADVFHCPICCHALDPPIHQCQNGHVMCSKCCVNLNGKCPSCSEIIGLIRCLTLEKIIESMEISCSNAGCDAIVSYLDRASHQKSCIYAQCFCPLCSFQGCMSSLSQHVADNHKKSAVQLFSYESCFDVRVTDHELNILIAPDNRLFLLLIKDVAEGVAFSVIGICPAAEDYKFTYKLSVYNHPNYIELRSSGSMTCEWKGVHPKTFLLVPADAFPCHKLQVCVTITKKNMRP
ncbi:E3 ubiquitin-protein ligase SINA-like 10 [Dioscorea cayenensis subsp. rotundata]|uniref:RING-type E3 ubiquitin transferase n=1 Tax=Dioscorea cayennensis subsp. rotundata TaxID=55577 RepID=A0AB40CZ66_DIOCR|nr:E3 ubiquitin-protein ligase SINA-like 10 [Dioscorea cayenensis subsp. rotundata]